MNIFFTGCTHFDHANIISLCNRPFANVEDMNEAMIERWNEVVGPKDTIYHLGDFGYINHRDRAEELLGKLNGKKILVRGNHDDNPVRWSGHWLSIHPYLEVEGYGKKIVLFHYPIDDWNGRFKGSIHLHCHTHSRSFANPHYFDGQKTVNRFNVGVDACDFTPVSLEHILKSTE